MSHAKSRTIYGMQFMNEWKKFLLEEYELTVNPSEYENYGEFKKDFERAAKNKAFVESFMDALMRLELRPLMKSLTQEQRRVMFQHVKVTPSIPNSQFINDNVLPLISNDSAIAKAGYKFDSSKVFDLISYYISYFTNKKQKEKFEKKVMQFPELFQILYWELFKKYPEEAPTISKIYKADTSTQNRRENVRILNHNGAGIQLNDIEEPSILDQIKIIKKIGKGAFGTVYELEDGRAFKIFSFSVDLDKDLQRYEKVMDQLYKGQASMEDMHIFDYGKLGKSNFYFAVMPKIVPLSETPAFKENAIFHSIAKANKDTAQKGIADSFERFKRLVLAEAGTIYVQAKDKFGNSNLSFQQAYNKYSDMADEIIKAGWRAYNEYGGTDIHSGNIGYFPQIKTEKPQLFYFDM